MVQHFPPDAQVTAVGDALHCPHPPTRIGAISTRGASWSPPPAVVPQDVDAALPPPLAAPDAPTAAGLGGDGGGDKVDAQAPRRTAPHFGWGGIYCVGRGGEHRRWPPPMVWADARYAA